MIEVLKGWLRRPNRMSGNFDQGRSVRAVIIEMHRRASIGFQHAPFHIAFWVGLIGAGGLGVWIEVYRLVTGAHHAGIDNIRTALSTFFPAVVGATSLQIAFEDPVKANRGVAVSALFLLLLMFFIMSDSNLSHKVAFTIGILASAASLWIWCAANGTSPSFQETPTNAPIGDIPLDAALPGVDDLGGMKH